MEEFASLFALSEKEAGGNKENMLNVDAESALHGAYLLSWTFRRANKNFSVANVFPVVQPCCVAVRSGSHRCLGGWDSITWEGGVHIVHATCMPCQSETEVHCLGFEDMSSKSQINLIHPVMSHQPNHSIYFVMVFCQQRPIFSSFLALVCHKRLVVKQL